MKLTKIFLLCLISILFSCKKNQNEGVISDTDTLLVNDPKRAIAILDSLEQVSSLNWHIRHWDCHWQKMIS